MKLIGYYNYTVILTYLGTVFGFLGITYIYSGNNSLALLCLMFSGLCDMFDGTIASTRKRTKSERYFGIQIDSLNDLICFGVLPALLLFSYCKVTVTSIAVSVMYLLCVLIRLAWFNVDEEVRQVQQSGKRTTYLGLPVTSCALIIPLLVGLGQLLAPAMKQYLYFLLIGLAIAYLLPFQLKKPGVLGKIIFLLLGICGFTITLLEVSI